MASINFNWKKLIKFLGPLLFVFFLIRVVDPKLAAQYLRGIRIDLVLISFLLFPIIMYAKTLRWWIICRHLDLTIPMNRLFQINYIAWFLGNIPPGGMAALSKIVYFKEEGKPVGSIFISIFMEKFLDVLGLMLLGLYGLCYFPTGLMGADKLWIIFIVSAAFVLLGFSFKGRLLESCQRWFKRRLFRQVKQTGDRFETALNQFWSGFEIRLFTITIGLSIAIYILMSLALYILALAMGIQLPFGFTVACMALIGIVNIIPITVSGLGTRDAILLLTLPLAGYSREAALALGLTAFLWATVFKFSGIIFWLKNPLPTEAFVSLKKKFFKKI